MPRFLEAVTPDRARELLALFGRIDRTEPLGLQEALGRVIARELLAPEPLPAFGRSQMDGYAVRAADTFGAGESAPAYLALAGRIAMGRPGGALPEGADAVVMVEYCREVGAGQLEVARAVAPGENVLAAGDDLAPGARLITGGRRLRPQELLALAAVGIEQVEVVARPRVGILSTGDELVAPGALPGPGQVRDANATAIAAQVREAGALPVPLGRCGDEPQVLYDLIDGALPGLDALLVSGGSSQGARDSTAEVLARFGPPGVLAHGIAVAPGKPTILAAAGSMPLIGLPGHPVSSLVIVRLFIDPMLRRLGGESGALDPFPARVRARLARPVASKPGREDWVRVALRDGIAEPLLKGSGAISTASMADGLVPIGLDSEGLAAGEEVEVRLF